MEKCDTSASAQFQSEETGLLDGIGTKKIILGTDPYTGQHASCE